MTTRKNLRDLALAASAFTAIVALATSASAAVIQSAPVSTSFATALRFDPTGPSAPAGLAFDDSLGTLASVTLSFAGTVSLTGSAFLTDPAPYPATVSATVGVLYTGNNSRTLAAAETVAVDATAIVTPSNGSTPVSYPSIRFLGQSEQSFSLTVSGADYGQGVLYTSLSLGELGLLAPTAAPDAVFRGTMTALFDYRPASGETAGDAGTASVGASAQNVPEPASVAVLGFGLVGLAAVRRRMA